MVTIKTSINMLSESIESWMFHWKRPYQASHAQLKAKHQIELLSFKPVDCIGVLGHSQGLSSNTTQKKMKSGSM